ncbi:type IV secretory system conjugative DNA transfer family protein [Chitinophaga solisilvae]|uniref:type IV secretory system conjugative DNA transfer family protein n=1 Tax=Chitinophaga solisilvae TaxID=1233460 RepID=UPI001368CAF6|nr:type IV secretion system DNA-binding domain-containing protein [Chitinophaga solisilvae]
MSEFKDHFRHVEGLELITDASRLVLPPVTPRCILSGADGRSIPFRVPLSEELMSKHLLLLGNIGTGKTTAISQIIHQIKNTMTADDVMVIFDTKGDFYERFHTDNDIVISNDVSRFKGSNYWNIFREITIDGTPRSIRENALEIANNLFADKIKNTNQPFFPQAAKDILATFLTLCAMDESAVEENSNAGLVHYLENATRHELLEYFSENGQNRISSYLSPDAAAQSDGVLAELYQLLSEIFTGDFREHGSLSIRDLIRQKGGRIIFVEYDITVGSILAPVYRLLFDLAIKEGMGKNRSRGNTWFIIDEFRLIPNLQHIDNGINFGRSQGLKFVLGLQNIPQVYNAYGEAIAESLLSGLSTTISFRVDDKKSRDFIQHRYGSSLKKLVFRKSGQVAQGQIAEEVRTAKVIEDWDISRLGTGEAIIGIPNVQPFIFRFNQ